jgi:hypothetical protein
MSDCHTLWGADAGDVGGGKFVFLFDDQPRSLNGHLLRCHNNAAVEKPKIECKHCYQQVNGTEHERKKSAHLFRVPEKRDNNARPNQPKQSQPDGGADIARGGENELPAAVRQIVDLDF